MSFTPSKYQQALFGWIEQGKGSAILEAVAGSGKTTTIVEALKLIPQDNRAVFLAFNRSIAEELKNRVPQHAFASTFHSAGFRAWSRVYPGVQVDDRKVMKLVRETPFAYTETAPALANLVGLAKQRGIGVLAPDDEREWADLIDHYDVNVAEGEEPEVIKQARIVLRRSTSTSDQVIDYDDMLYMPVLRGLALNRYAWVMIDEAQDTNGVRRALAGMMLDKDARMVAVGDTHQAIYGFTGADSEAMNLIQQDFGCQRFPLSINYRSGRRIVTEAQKYVPEIEPREDAPEGLVAITSYRETPPEPGDAILCRLNAPLIEQAYEFISQGRGCRVLGRDIGQGLVRLVDKMDARNLEELRDSLESYRTREFLRFMRREQEGRAQGVRDRVNCIFAVINHLNVRATVDDLKRELDNLFQEKPNGGKLLTLSTVHKAKGLEWNRVFIHGPELMPCKWAKMPWQKQQERNLQYVAVTRARDALYYVPMTGGNHDNPSQ